MPTVERKRQLIAQMLRDRARQSLYGGAGLSAASRGADAHSSAEPIAIVGLSGYFPGCMTVQEFWQSLDDDRSLIEEIPRSRFDWRQIYDPTGEDGSRSRCKWGGFIPDIRQFDARFFGTLPSEARLMDPRQRLLLMSVYRGIEDAGHAPSSLRQKPVGVFIAVEDDEYLQLMQTAGVDPGDGFGHVTGMIANAISYAFDFTGPSETVSAQCAGGAVALHQAVRLLRSGEITHAVVGAANLLLRAEPFIRLSRLGQLSRTASVASFGKEAGGYLRAEGVASVILRPLSQALIDGDPVYAVIRHSAVNYNGRGMSIAAPNASAHADLIAACYRKAAIDPRRVRYIEAQGMGNPVADVAEWQAFDRALRALAREQGLVLEAGQCAVSSLKPMTGHMHSASALGALFKIIRSLQTSRVHRILGFRERNPDLAHPDDVCRPASATEAWPNGDGPRLAGLHSYGSGGCNAHVLVEEFLDSRRGTPGDGLTIIPVSTRSHPECVDAVRQLLGAVQGLLSDSFADFAHTLQHGRDEYDHRVAFVADGCSTWIGQAEAYLRGQTRAGVYEGVVDALNRGKPAENLTDPNDIARCWVKGREVRWDRCFANRGARRLHLPTYPFVTRSYWFDQGWIDRGFVDQGKDDQGKDDQGKDDQGKDDQAVASKPVGESKAETIVRTILSDWLAVLPADIDLDAQFSELGFDSIRVIGIASRLKSDYGVHFEPAELYEYQCARMLIQGVDRRQERQPGPSVIPTARVDVPVRRGGAGSPEPIAIIGLAGSFPRSPTTGDLWSNLSNSVNCVAEVPAERWRHADYFEPDPDKAVREGKSYGKWGGFLDDLYCFDPRFFSISPREAAAMNPKERLFLQCAWHVLEDAGWPPGSLSGERVGVFVGATKAGQDLHDSSLNAIANRVSYCFDFHGPSIAIDTTCSSSLVALNEACLHMRAGECSVAIAGGVHAILHPTHFAALAKGRFLSPDGTCKPFSANANGMAPGEGVGAVLLKPLSKAQRDHDHIYAVIRGVVTNSGGKTNGYTVPSPLAQRSLIRGALERSGVHARHVSYVEAHGTGTALGDPIEVRALTEAFREDTADAGYCRLGSAKGNLGHLEAAAGIAGLAKILLQMKYRRLVPSLPAGELNPQIDFPNTPFRVQRELEDWNPTDRNGEPITRIACVSSFGAGGTNAHAVIEEHLEAPQARQAAVRQAPQFIVLSARNSGALSDSARALSQHLRSERVGGADEKRLGQVRRALATILKVDERDPGDDEPFDSLGVDRLQLSRLTTQLARGLEVEIDPDVLRGTDSIRSAAWRLFPECSGAAAHECQERSGNGCVADLAYTLQVGREPMGERLGFLANSPEEIEEGLQAFLQPDDGPANRQRLFFRRPENSGLRTTGPQADRADSGQVASWIDRGAYNELLTFWVGGGNIDWSALYGDDRPHGATPRRIHLPGYPFAREKYGVPDLSGAKTHETAAAKTHEPAESDQPETHAAICFEEVWEEKALSSASPANIPDLKYIVCFLSTPEYQRAFLECARTLNPHVEVIFVVDRGNAADFEGVLRRIQSRDRAIDAVLYLWPFDDPRDVRGVSSPVALIQALAASHIPVARVVFGGAPEGGLDLCYLESWIGFERTSMLVLPRSQVSVFIEDRTCGEPSNDFSRLARTLLAELPSGSLESVLYRRGARHVLRCRRADMPAVREVFRPGSIYLITGGLGSLGFEFAAHLAKKPSSCLILTGRSALDAEQRQRIDSLRALGARVHYLRADVSDIDAMRAGLSEIKPQYGPIRGVIHAAGLPASGDIRTKALRDFQAVMRPKIDGTLVLDELLDGESLDFVCYFSSSSAILGDLGSCDYAVANRFQMAFANFQNVRPSNGARRAKALAICWPLWASGGMRVVDADQMRLYLKSSGQRALTSQEGVEIFERLLSQTRPHQLVLAGEERRLLRLPVISRDDVVSPKQHLAQRRQRGAGLSGLSIEECVSLELRKTIVELLGCPPDSVGVDTNLADFGFDSITLTQFASAIASLYGVDVTAAVFFVHTTVAQLTRYLLTEHGAMVRAFYGETRVPPADEFTNKMRLAAAGAFGVSGSAVQERIAIVGISGMFPQCRNTEEMWKVLSEGSEAIEEIPLARFDWRLHYGDPATDSTKTNGKWCGAVPGVAEFDPHFFGISPREADDMDPRQRLLLQESWRALEDAGYGPGHIGRQRIGIFVGAEEGEYQRLGGTDQITSNHNALLAARLAYALGFSGPVMTINTACSSSLVAAHQACSSLRLGECDIAIAAGVNLMLTPEPYIAMSRAGMLSGDGKCFAFDERANGLVPGEALAVVVLRRLSEAEGEGDPVYAVIRGSGINYDGKTNGITAPSGKAQASLIQDVYRRAGVQPREIEHVVTHGTGTVLGDAVELNALRSAFEGPGLDAWCALTSCKTNFGHTFAASGLVSVISLTLGMKHEIIPASLHCDRESDVLRKQPTPFYLNRSSRPWKRKEGLLRTGAVSAFGMSGTNAHLVLQDYVAPPDRSTTPAAPFFLLALSGKTQQALEERVAGAIRALSAEGVRAHGLARVSHTLLDGRHHFRHRCAIVVRDAEEAIDAWRRFRKERRPNIFAGQVASGFTGTKAVRSYALALAAASRAAHAEPAEYRENLYALADFYCQGYDLPWADLYDGLPPRRIHLPTYPFSRERHWVALREAGQGAAPAEEQAKLSMKTHLLCPSWNRVTVLRDESLLPRPASHAIVLGASAAQRAEALSVFAGASSLDADEGDAPGPPVDHVLWIAPETKPRDGIGDWFLEEQEWGLLAVFRLLKTLLARGYRERDLSWTFVTRQARAVYPHETVNPVHAGVHGLVGSMAKEFPRWNVRLVDLEAGDDLPLRELLSLPFHPRGHVLARRGAQWLTEILVPARNIECGPAICRRGGVYVVIGGAGGIGEAWTRWAIEQYQAQVIWIGRRRHDTFIEAKLDAVSAAGPRPVYIQADAGDRQALEGAYGAIKARHERIHGVIHSAVGLFDRSLEETDEERFRTVLSAKIDVSVRVAQVFAAEQLDFVLFFSSTVAFGKDGGLSGYAAGCSFADAFARRLGKVISAKVKVMNWGYWSTGAGLAVPKAAKVRLEQSGIGAIESTEGMQALDALLRGPMDQLACIKALDAGALAEVETNSWVTNYPATISPVLPEFNAASLLNEQGIPRSLPEHFMEDPLLKGLLLEFLRRALEADPANAQRPAFYDRWIEESRRILARSTLPQAHSSSPEELWKRWDQAKRGWLQNSQTTAAVTLVEACLRNLAEVISGRRRAVDIVFPDSSMSLVEGVYGGHPVADFFNDALARTLVEYIRMRRSRKDSALGGTRQLRILEIGAGTGGTTARVLPALAPFARDIAEYCYTDLSRAFLFRAEEAFAPAAPYLTTRIFNVAEPIAPQNIDGNRFDIAIATNVLHATADIREALRNAKAALKKNGLLLINEITRTSLYGHMTFGLLEGWWMPVDRELRMEGSPGLFPARWRSLLAEEGFGSVQFPVEFAEVLGQQLIAAESDGIVRQRQANSSPQRSRTLTSVTRTDEEAPKRESDERTGGGITDESLRERSRRYFTSLLANNLRMPAHRLDVSEPLENYGIDSILAVQATNELRKAFGRVSSTLFFEIRTINELVEHFVSLDRTALAALVGCDGAPPDLTVRPPPIEVAVTSEAAVTSGRAAHAEPAQRTAIAIVGMSGRYPAAETLDQFWENLTAGRSSVTEIPADRWPLAGFHTDDREQAAAQGKSYSKWGAFVEGFADFDPLFFNIAPREAMAMDPQERLFLQMAWWALEDAGYTRQSLKSVHRRRVGVFAGITRAGFELYGPELWKSGQTVQLRTSFSSVANRLSYVLDLAGPSMPIDTMCSSSLTAIHEACEHLHRGECEMAFAGGVNLYLHPSSYVDLCSQGMLSPDGRCRSFGSGADGFVPGEGVGVVLLKPLPAAVRDGDRIHAVIRGTSVNHGGRTSGYTVPNPVAQAELIKEALAKAGVNARTVSYVEAHGTGTELGDPIEVNGLIRAFRHDTQDAAFCALGSVKSNLGHLEAASGIAGVTKTVLQMKHGQLAPSLHSSTLNPLIDFDGSPFFVPQERTEWKRPLVTLNGETREWPRVAGVSSFGAGGANAHVILEEYVPVGTEPAGVVKTQANPAIVLLSARTEEQLQCYAASFLAFLRRGDQPPGLADLAYTLQIGREAFDNRAGFVVTSLRVLEERLDAFVRGQRDDADVFVGKVERGRGSLAVFLEDEDLAGAIDAWIAHGKYSKLAEFWVRGLSVDWNKLYARDRPQRIEAPKYPFARERYWILDRSSSVAEASGNQPFASLAPNHGEESTFLVPVWDSIALSEHSVASPARIAVVSSCRANAESLQRQDGTTCILEIGAHDTVEALMAKCVASGSLSHVIWIAPESPVSSPADEAVVQNQVAGVCQLFRLVKALLALGYGLENFSLTAITLGSQRVHPEDALNPTHAGVHGLVGSLAKEYPHWTVRSVDLESTGNWPAEDILRLPNQAGGAVYAYRGGEWWQQCLLSAGHFPLGRELYRKHGVYVVIGGRGGLGEAWSRLMIRDYQARIVWLGRKEIDAQIQGQLRALASPGLAPIYLRSDATDRGSLEDAYRQIRKQFGQINGVIHSALVLSDQAIEHMDELRFRTVLESKVNVCVRLAQVFGREPLDFALFFSSTSAFGKPAGQSNYAAGCTFKDAFAARLSTEWSCPVKVMNWGYWGSVGFAARSSYRELMNRAGLASIEPEEGMQALEVLLRGPLGQLGFIKQAGSSEIAELKAEASLSYYRETIPSRIRSLEERRIEPAAQLARARLAELRHAIPDELLMKLFMSSLQAGDVFREGKVSAGEIPAKAKVSGLQERWFEESLGALTAAGYLEKSGNGWTVVSRALDAAALWSEWDRAGAKLQTDAEESSPFRLIDECLRSLPRILTGELSAADVLFPNASMVVVEGVYRGNAVADCFNQVMRDTLDAYIEVRLSGDPGAGIRILEIGAGTGGTTASVRDVLKRFGNRLSEYCYTDVSNAFLLHGQAQYASQIPNFVTRIFDVAMPIAAQGIAGNHYDVVIAANVLHATPNIRESVRNAKAALRKNGILLLNEINRNSLFHNLTFGLLKEWWSYEDAALRIPGCPALSSETWSRVLSGEGFGTVYLPGVSGRDLGQQVIVAESDGVVRQRAARSRTEPKTPQSAQTSTPIAQTSPSHTRPETEDGPQAFVSRAVIESLSQSLQVPGGSIDPRIPFSDYGLDSILGIRAVKSINDRLGIKLNSTVLFEHATVERLTAHIVSRHEEALTRPAEHSPPAGRESTPLPVESPMARKNSGTSCLPSDVAVIGMSGQFPGASDVDSFWQNLIDGRDGIPELSLENRALFDPLFFNLSPREAEAMNPHQRLILQEGWRSLEDAGYNPKSLAGSKVSVFIGAELSRYGNASFTGSSEAIVASRLSYYLDLKGPAMVINTGCSSSGTAIHLACESLRHGESSMVLAGGVFAALDRELIATVERTGMLSRKGSCNAFDAGADGTVFAEAVGVVVLKRLDDALRDEDHIYGVIQGSGVNQDGTSNGITAPNGDSQEELITGVYSRFKVDPACIGYVEAHGTGTELGDPVEANALVRAFRTFTSEEHYCAVGSAKSHVGHTAAAAGIVGLIKMLLSLKHGVIPRMPHFERLNPLVEFDRSPFYVNTERITWASRDGRPRMGVLSSFGHSGTNVHIVVREHQSGRALAARKSESPRKELIVLSARTPERLIESARNLRQFLLKTPPDLGDLAYTLQIGREAMEERVAFLTSGIGDCVEQLQAVGEGGTPAPSGWRGSSGDRPALHTGTEALGLEKASELWASGGKVDWRLLPRDGEPRRVSLPSYPFALERYWLEPGEPASILPNAIVEEPFKLMGFEEVWRAAELAPPAHEVEMGPRTLLCLLSGAEAQRALREEMRLLQPRTSVVFAARPEAYRRDSAEAYSVSLNSGDSFGESLRAICAESESGGIDDVLYLWALEDHACVRDTTPIVTMLQQMAHPRLRPKRILLAGAFERDADRCYVESWIGFERSLRLAWPDTEVRVVVQEGRPSKEAGELLRQVVAELVAGRARSVLYLEHQRRELDIVSRTLTTGKSAIPQEATILITGGAGGLGLIFAEHLARTRGLNLILTGRSAMDQSRQNCIEKLKVLGSEAIYIQGNVCDPAAMRKAIDTAKARFGKVNGVIHAAGVSDGLTIFEKDPKSFQTVLLPKVTGTVVVDELLADEPLSFVCYFSSTAAVLGDFGACDYAVGNRFQMSYGRYREELRRRGERSGKTVVINWPLWRDGGMGVGDSEQQQFYLKSGGQRALAADEGLSVFERTMRAESGQYIVVAGKPSRVERFLRQSYTPAPAPARASSPDTAVPANSAGPRADEGEERNQLIAELRTIVSRHLRVPETLLHRDKNLGDVGLDSILLAELAQLLSKRYGVEVTPAVLFGHPTLGHLARYFREGHRNVVRRPYSERPSSPRREESSRSTEEPIAIIGLSGRFGRADSVAELWQRVKQGASCITDVPDERWYWRRDGGVACVRGAFIYGVDRFDPLFFSIAPRDANAMDPCQRLFLEEAWHAFEDAGYMGARVRGKSCGVYVGVEEGDYRILTEARGIDGSQNATLAARIGYALDLKGPNFALTASCSSGLVAVHQACLALRQGDCELALAGAVSLMLSSTNYEALLEAGMLSTDGACRVFDQGASGLVPGEAVAAVVLKPLSQALRDGDHVYARIVGSGVNYDGASNGITAPNYVSQSELLTKVYDRYGIDPADIQFAMAHSVGSRLTDPVEVEALTAAFRKYTRLAGYCRLGSVKPLVGHTFAASGLVSLICVVMAMRDRIIPGTSGYERANGDLRLEGSPFVVSGQNADWNSRNGRPRAATVSTSGISGTNAHVVIEENVETEAPTTSHATASNCAAPLGEVAVLSARNPERLIAVAHRMIDFLEANPELSLPNLCYTLQVGREAMKDRWAAVVSSVAHLVQELRGLMACGPIPAEDQATGSIARFAQNDWNLVTPEGLCAAWLRGADVPWERLHAGRSPRIISLPTYPFVRRSCWSQRPRERKAQAEIATSSAPANPEVARRGNKVVDLYSYLAKDKTAEFQTEYLTFFPFPAKLPGFSMTRIALNPERYPDEVALIKATQNELRQVLFFREDFREIQSVLDFGCGHGTDVIQIASLYPHIRAHGITITPAQAELGRSRIERLGLNPRAAIFNQDSSQGRFPGRYDLIFGIEVACHIPDKRGLFDNIVASLNEGGRVLLMEFIANLRGPIADPNVSVYIPTRENWAELLARHGLVVDESVDVSAEIANSQYDPEFELHIKDLPEVVAASWRNYANNSIAMSKGWVSYSLFRLHVDKSLSLAARKARNARKLANETPYREALAQMLRRGSHYPRPQDLPIEIRRSVVEDSRQYGLRSRGQCQ